MTREEIVAWVRYRTACPKSYRYDTPMGDAFRRAAGVRKDEPCDAAPISRGEEPSRFWERMMRQRIGALDRG